MVRIVQVREPVDGFLLTGGLVPEKKIVCLYISLYAGFGAAADSSGTPFLYLKKEQRRRKS